MKLHLSAALLASVVMSTSALAQSAPAPQPAAYNTTTAPVFAPVAPAAPAVRDGQLAANTPVVIALNGEVSSRTHRLGDQFSASVASDVMVDGHVVIPRGTRAVGHVTRRVGKGSFGKAGKMEVAFRYIDLGGRRIPVEGLHLQKGNSKGGATAGAVLLAGAVGGFFVKGRSATMGEGREFTAHTLDAIPVSIPTAAGAPALIQASYTPSPVSMNVETPKERKRRAKEQASAAKRRA